MELQALVDRHAVIEVINNLFASTDRRDWEAVRQCLAPTVLLDMTSLAGGEPAELTPEQDASGWEVGLRPWNCLARLHVHAVLSPSR